MVFAASASQAPSKGKVAYLMEEAERQCVAEVTQLNMYTVLRAEVNRTSRSASPVCRTEGLGVFASSRIID